MIFTFFLIVHAQALSFNILAQFGWIRLTLFFNVAQPKPDVKLEIVLNTAFTTGTNSVQ